jgi:hypothetical protein
MVYTLPQYVFNPTCLLLVSSFGLLFDSEDESDMFSQKVGWLSQNYAVLIPE